MKKHHVLLLGSFITLLFSQCSKQGDLDGLTPDGRKAKTEGMGCNCTESSRKITGSQAEALAKAFAPLLKFDQASPDYPTSVMDVWNATSPASIVCGGKLVLTDRTAPRSMNFPTYYEVQSNPNDPNKVFIDYWWVYKRQENCFADQGGHDYDLEHTVIQVNKATQQAISVTYFQHAGWYTKKANAVMDNNRVAIFVGKIAHGSYHNRNTISFPGYSCSYWGDYRNPNGDKDYVQTTNNLVQMSCSIDQFNFDGNWGDPGKGPLFRDRAYWNYKTCRGTDGLFGQDGCSASDYDQNALIGNL